ncbi:MAG TPA: 50S ribosomal protein L21 [Bauldia sp.]|nr:50S ribosomal protein L21 [Bauldia sp.]
MFAVIKTGGKQYRVSPSDTITVEKLDGGAGDSVTFDQVMLVGGGEGAEPTIGAPLVEGVTVAGEIVEQTRGAKVLVFKKRRRKNSKRSRGHRQSLTVVKITDILTREAKTRKTASRSVAKDGPEAAPAEATQG